MALEARHRIWQRREWVDVDVAAAFLIVTLGKRPPMPYVWLPHRVGPPSASRGATDVRTTVWAARMVEVPNPYEFLG